MTAKSRKNFPTRKFVRFLKLIMFFCRQITRNSRSDVGFVKNFTFLYSKMRFFYPFVFRLWYGNGRVASALFRVFSWKKCKWNVTNKKPVVWNIIFDVYCSRYWHFRLLNVDRFEKNTTWLILFIFLTSIWIELITFKKWI